MAQGKTSAFTKCSGFAGILAGLENRPVTNEKPMARKKRAKKKGKAAKEKGKAAKTLGRVNKALRASAAKKLGAVKARPAGVQLVNVKAEPDITSSASSAGSLGTRPANPLGTQPANPGGDRPDKAPLSMSRKCVHSRAYSKAKKEAKNQGKSKDEMRDIAGAAARAAAAQWDIEFE